MKKIRILSIDGGGIRGILPGTILTYIEDQIQLKTNNKNAKVGEYFDFLAGTSTGGMLSLVYVCPNAQGGYKFSARDALDLYLKKGGEIFDVSFGQKIKSLGGVRDEKYNAKNMEKALDVYFGTTRLSQALKPCLVSSYDLENRKAKFFTSADALENNDDFYIKHVARATSAAPTYFEPTKLVPLGADKNATKDKAEFVLVDGGVFANNPALCAYAEARNTDFGKIFGNPEKPNKPTASQMIIVSLGTGTVKKPYLYEDFKDAGMIAWIQPLIDIMMSGNSETVAYQIRQIYDTLKPADTHDYHRIQPALKKEQSAMDNADPENLKALHAIGKASVSKNKDELDKIVDKLIANH
jgi:patatin-like phospholipase/acyl hydrolase